MPFQMDFFIFNLLDSPSSPNATNLPFALLRNLSRAHWVAARPSLGITSNLDFSPSLTFLSSCNRIVGEEKRKAALARIFLTACYALVVITYYYYHYFNPGDGMAHVVLAT